MLQAYCSLLDALAATAGTEAVGRAAALACSALSRFEIKPPVALKALLGLLLSRARPPERSAAAAADVVEALVHPKASAQDDAIGAADEIDETRGGSEGTLQGDGAAASVRGSGSGAGRIGTAPSAMMGSALSATARAAAAAVRLRLCASVATRTAALHLALAHFKSILDDEPSATAARLLPMLPSLRRALEALFTPLRSSVEREVTGAPAVVSRVILLMAQLLGAVIKQAAAAKAAQRSPAPASSVDLRVASLTGLPAQRRLDLLETVSGTTTLVAATSTLATTLFATFAPATTLVAATSAPCAPEAASARCSVVASARCSASGPVADAPSPQHPLELLRASIPAWVECVPLTRLYASWLRKESASWSAPNRRRVPAALYTCERATLALLDALSTPAGASLVRVDAPTATLFQAIQHDWAVSSNGKAMTAARRLPSTWLPANSHEPSRVVSVTGATKDNGGTGREVDDEEGDEEGDEEEQHEETVELLQPRAASRRRLRSRNPFIDSELGRGGGGDDSYADLEDFIVCKRGRQY